MKKKTKIAVAAIATIFILYLGSWQLDFSRGNPRWGATFSQLYAEELKLDWKETYRTILDELPLQTVRLVAYWNRIEPEKGKFDFSDLDWQVGEAQKRNKEIVLVSGFRVPRWPECHMPAWAASLPKEEFEKAVLNHLEAVVNHYKADPAIKIWQVENEPLLSVFGMCPKPDKELLSREITLVKSLDPGRPILITGSGELSLNIGEAGLSQIFGTTLYRTVWDKRIGFWTHLYPPAFYAAKAWSIKTFSDTDDVVIAELQAEPWGSESVPLSEMPLDEQTAHFNADDLRNNMEFAGKTGIRDIYLWGPEWWYWRKLHGDPSFWETAGEIIAGTR